MKDIFRWLHHWVSVITTTAQPGDACITLSAPEATIALTSATATITLSPTAEAC